MLREAERLTPGDRVLLGDGEGGLVSWVVNGSQPDPKGWRLRLCRVGGRSGFDVLTVTVGPDDLFDMQLEVAPRPAAGLH